MHERPPVSKVYYRPIEAAIRWAGLLRYKKVILSSVAPPRHLPERLNCPRLGDLRLCTDRIYDAIYNGELPYGLNGITQNDKSLWNSPDLTIRHTDLKRWMRHHYPEHRPTFLFSRRERIAHPVITFEAGQAMLIERQALETQLEQCQRQLREVHEKYRGMIKHGEAIPACGHCPISNRSETTYLHIIGSMLELMLGHTPSGVPYSSFKTQEAIVSTMVAHHGKVMGISERTLNGKFAGARRKLSSTTS